MDIIAEIRRRHLVSGESISSLARSLNLSRPTVRKHLNTTSPQVYRRQHTSPRPNSPRTFNRGLPHGCRLSKHCPNHSVEPHVDSLKVCKLNEILSRLVGTDAWNNLPDVYQKKLYEKAINEGRKVGRAEALTPEQRTAEAQRIYTDLQSELSRQ